MNGRILRETPFDAFFAPPAAADAGTALGAALLVAARLGHPRPTGDYVYLGPRFGDDDVEAALRRSGLPYTRPDDVARHAAERIAAGGVVGWFQGRMEAGPRALGNRSILADPRSPDSKPRLNEKVKHREPFRPFAPSVLEERASDYFATDHPSPVMLLVSDVLPHRRDELPAITHVDGTARVQTVSQAENPLYWRLIRAFDELTGVPMVVNTSFNDNDEPIVCSPDDALRCFLKTDLDGLAIGPFWVEPPAAGPATAATATTQTAGTTAAERPTTTAAA
jgi:carbamoyltransferase